MPGTGEEIKLNYRQILRLAVQSKNEGDIATSLIFYNKAAETIDPLVSTDFFNPEVMDNMAPVNSKERYEFQETQILCYKKILEEKYNPFIEHRLDYDNIERKLTSAINKQSRTFRNLSTL